VSRDPLADELVARYPNIYQQYQLTDAQRKAQGYYNSFDAYGFETPPGWDNVLRRLSATLSNICVADGCEINVVQVKEKFGGLRFYYDGKGDCARINAAIAATEAECYQTCGNCGEPGTLVNDHGWLAVLCDKHKSEDTEEIK
jgi:hypothetical protein